MNFGTRKQDHPHSTSALRFRTHVVVPGLQPGRNAPPPSPFMAGHVGSLESRVERGGDNSADTEVDQSVGFVSRCGRDYGDSRLCRQKWAQCRPSLDRRVTQRCAPAAVYRTENIPNPRTPGLIVSRLSQRAIQVYVAPIDNEMLTGSVRRLRGRKQEHSCGRNL